MVDSILHHKKVSTELVGNLQYGVPKLCTNLRSNAEMLFKHLPSAITNGFERNEFGFSIATLPLAGIGMVRGIAMAMLRWLFETLVGLGTT